MGTSLRLGQVACHTKAMDTLTKTSHRWQCTDCKKVGLWFPEGQKVSTTNNGTRHADRFGHTTYMVNRQWGYDANGEWFETEPAVTIQEA
jgi:hypothetical protein